jgi:hypothetical protein
MFFSELIIMESECCGRGVESQFRHREVLQGEVNESGSEQSAPSRTANDKEDDSGDRRLKLTFPYENRAGAVLASA